MEAFSLLKYWRAGGGGAPPRENSGISSFVTADDDAVDSDEDGPFFDLEFAVPGDEEDDEDDNASTCAEEGESDEEDEFGLALSSDSGEDRPDPNLTLSPSDDLFFKGRLVTVEPNEPDTAKPAQFPVSLRKSATKFRVMMLGFRKSKQSTAEKTEQQTPKQPAPEQDTAGVGKEKKKLLTVKFKVEEVRIMSLFTRDNTSGKTSTAKKAPAPEKQSRAAGSSGELSSTEEKLFSKDVMQKYIRKVKPLYVRVSRRYGDKLRFSGQLTLGSGAKPPPSPPDPKSPESIEAPAPKIPKAHKQGKNIQAGLRAVSKHLGKSRSALSAVAAAPPTAAPSKRRDDSLLQLQDGIQGAILHCKKSFNSSDSGLSVLSRSASDSAKDEPGGDDDESRRQSSEEEHGVA